MKVAYVVPRYGTEVVGGAEFAARMLAERLAARPGWEVEVLTTCALETTDLGRPRTRRARRAQRRDRAPLPLRLGPRPRLRAPQPAGPGRPAPRRPGRRPALDRPPGAAQPRAGRRRRGQRRRRRRLLPVPVPPDRARPAAASGAGACSTRPPTTSRRCACPCSGPCSPPPPGSCSRPRASAAWSSACSPWPATRQIVLGLGVDEGPGEPRRPGRRWPGSATAPTCSTSGGSTTARGRPSWPGSSPPTRTAGPGPLALVVAGPVVDPPPPAPDVLVAGPVDEPAKWGLLRGADAFVHPSAYEAFSLALVEAWAAGRPVLVNARCAATREHCERSGGGLWFDGYAAFEAALDRLLGDDDLREAMARRGAATWPAPSAGPASSGATPRSWRRWRPGPEVGGAHSARTDPGKFDLTDPEPPTEEALAGRPSEPPAPARVATAWPRHRRRRGPRAQGARGAGGGLAGRHRRAAADRRHRPAAAHRHPGRVGRRRVDPDRGPRSSPRSPRGSCTTP